MSSEQSVPVIPRRSSLEIPPGLFLVAFVIIAFGAMGENVLLTVSATIVLFFGSWLLWRPGESPILLFVFAFQWLQASTKIFYANLLGSTVGDITPTGDVEMAIVLSLLGVAALALGLRLGAGRANTTIAELILATSQRRGPKEWFYIYVLFYVLSLVVSQFAWITPGLTQPILAAASVKWAFYWMLTYASFGNPNSNRLYWLLAFLMELVTSLGGFFADFRTVFFFSLLGMLAVPVRRSLASYARVAGLTVLMLLFALIWTAIKTDYRYFVSQGSVDQVVSASYGSRIVALVDLIAELTGDKLVLAANDLVNRVSYVDFFAIVVTQVPDVIPHDDGAIWLDALSRPFMPRLLFPEKTAIDDSARSNDFGVVVSGADVGTSIGMGYFAETYIDFGKVMMMSVICAFGLALGYTYRKFLYQSQFGGFLGMALATNLLFQVAPLETSITKLMGGLLVVLLVSWLTARLVVPMVAPWLSNTLGSRPHSPRIDLR